MKKLFLTGVAVMALTAFANAQTETPASETPPPAAEETPAPPPTDGTTPPAEGTTTDAAQPAALDSLGNPIPPAEGAPAAPEKPRYKLYSGKHRGNNSVGPKQ
ncbi:MAG TPA: hypothetical protein PKN75_12505 [Bacteroidia bacterium]|nr:hypothetical protein [Bacteroidia bacterium]HNU34399.1 hypothetical protein [Bacteroidia bacterium]